MGKQNPDVKTRNSLPFKKAGIVISGKKSGGTDPETYVIAPYTEGRFGASTKYYVVPKGTIDPGESVLDAAIRETSEETGIKIADLLGKEAIEKIKKGELPNCPYNSPGYSGVRITQIPAKVLDFYYNTRENTQNRTVMLEIEVEGIEQLAPHLKNLANAENPDDGRPGMVKTPVSAMLENLPSFGDLLAWVRTGTAPNKAWANALAGEARNLTLKDTKGNPRGKDWLQKLEEKYSKQHGPITSIAQWQRFIEAHPGHVRTTLQHAADDIKAKLKEVGLLGGDDSHLKLDTKDCPLVFYQEGADIIPRSQWLASCIANAAGSSDFARAFCGDTDKAKRKNHPPHYRITHSQMAAVVAVSSTQDIAAVAKACRDNFPNSNGVLWGRLTYDPGRGAHRNNLINEDANHMGAAEPLPRILEDQLTISRKTIQKNYRRPFSEVVNEVPHPTVDTKGAEHGGVANPPAMAPAATPG